MIDIYAMHFNQNGSIQESKTLIQTIPATEGEIYLINPKVSNKTGSAESLDFSVQPGTRYFDAFIQLRTYLYVEYDGELIFYGRVLTIEQGFYGEQKIKCEGAFAFFNDSYLPGSKEKTREDISLFTYISNILNNHNSQLSDPLRAIYPGEVPGNYTAATSAEQRIDDITRAFGESGWRQTKAALDDLTSHYGGMFRIRHGNDNKLYLDWIKHYYRSSVINQTVEVGKNLIDCSSITEVNNIFTVVIPIGKGPSSEDKLYIDGLYFPVSRVTEFYTDEELNSGYHYANDYREAEARYGKIIKPQEFNDATTEEELLSECAKWVKENYQGGIEEFTVSAVDLHQIGADNNSINKIMCGDRVPLRYPIKSGQLRDCIRTCTAATYELYNPESNQYTFGIPSSSLNKGYGVNSTKSQQDAESQDPPHYGDGPIDTRTDYQKWWDSVGKMERGWLWKHKVWKKSNGGTEGGPNSQGEFNYFCHYQNISGVKSVEIWVPRVSAIKEITIDGKKVRIYKWYTINGKPQGTWTRISRDDFAERKYSWTANNLIQYIHDEYSINISKKGNGIAYDMPDSTTEDPDSIINGAMSSIPFYDPDTGELKIDFSGMNLSSIVNTGREIFQATFGDGLSTVFKGGFNLTSFGNVLAGFGNTITTFTDGARERIKTIIGDLSDTGSGLFGNILSAFNIDPETGAEELLGSLGVGGKFFGADGFDTDTGDITAGTEQTGGKISLRDTGDKSKKLGFIAEKYFDDLEHPAVTHELTLGIEQVKNGEIVVARMSGDKVVIGGEATHQIINSALNNISNVCGNFTTEVDAQTGIEKVTVNEGSGLFLRKNGAEFGYYNEDSLTGGIMVEKLNDNTVTTHIKGNRIIVGTVDDQTAQTMQAKFGDVDGLIAQKATIAELNAAKARISTLETDYLKTTNLYSAISNLPVVRAIQVSSAEYLLRGADGQGHETSTSLKNSIKDLQIVANGSTGYKLQYKNYSSSDWQDAGTFSRATTLTGAWSGGIYTVTASPQGNTRTVGFAQNVDSPLTLATNGTPTSVSTNRKLVSAPVRIIETKGTTQTNVYTTTLTIDSTVAWNYGYDTARGYVGLPGAGTGTTFNVSVPKSDRSGSENKTFEITKGATPAASGYAAVNISGTVVGRIEIGDWYSAGVTAGKTAEKKLVKVRFNAASGAYYVEAYENVSGAPAISGASVTYKLGTSGSGATTVVQVQNSSGTKIGDTPELSLASIYTPETSEIGFDQLTIQPNTASIAGRTKAGSFKKSNLSAPGYLFFRVGCRGTNKLYYITVDP